MGIPPHTEVNTQTLQRTAFILQVKVRPEKMIGNIFQSKSEKEIMCLGSVCYLPKQNFPKHSLLRLVFSLIALLTFSTTS